MGLGARFLSPEGDEFTVDLPIGPVPHPILGRVHGVSSAGKASRTRVRVLERREGSFLAEVVIETVPVTGNVHMLTGYGGNIGVSVGDDGILIVDLAGGTSSAALAATGNVATKTTPASTTNTAAYSASPGAKNFAAPAD